jgi:hypothetical protein
MFFTNWAPDLLQKIYINLTLSPNNFKINQEIIIWILNLHKTKKHDTKQEFQVNLLFKFDLFNDENN